MRPKATPKAKTALRVRVSKRADRAPVGWNLPDSVFPTRSALHYPLRMSAAPPTNYWDYIRVDELLNLQSGLAEDDRELSNEEVLFVTVHQVFELWFKLVLRGLQSARDLFHSPQVEEMQLAGVVERLRRARTIFDVAVKHFEVVETLGTRDYLAFRSKLLPASGFQSAQMRRIEILLGLDDQCRVPLGEGGYLDALRSPDGSESSSYRAVQDQLNDTPSLKRAVEAWLLRTPIDGIPHDAPEATQELQAFIERFLAAHAGEVDVFETRALELCKSEAEGQRLRELYRAERASVRAFLMPSDAEGGAERARIRSAMVFIETYRDLPLLSWPREVLAALIEFEQSFLIFRQRHARMVERVIGRRTGTGGSSGVEYLDRTALSYRVFDDLWVVRTMQLSERAAPSLERAEFFGFRAEA